MSCHIESFARFFTAKDLPAHKTFSINDMKVLKFRADVKTCDPGLRPRFEHLNALKSQQNIEQRKIIEGMYVCAFTTYSYFSAELIKIVP